MIGGPRTASLAMYPFESARPAYERLWRRVVSTWPDLPPRLRWPDDVPGPATDSATIVEQTCGWPLITRLGDRVRVLGAFEMSVPQARGHRYRSVIVSGRHDVDPATASVAYNSPDSLSGWVSLLAWSKRTGPSLRSTGVATGSHVGSLEAVQSSHADVASIDSVTFAHLRRDRPELVDGLDVIGCGPLVPSLPVVVPAGVDDDIVDQLRRAFAAAIAVDRAARRTLFLVGFVPLEIEDYRRELAGLRSE